MFAKKKMLIVGAACIAVIGVAAFILLNGGTPVNPAPPGFVESESPPVPNVGEIVSPAAVNPDPITQNPAEQQIEDIPVFDPEGGDTDVSVPFIPEVSKPPEAETEADKETHERVEGADPATPPATQTPTHTPTSSAPPKQSEPQAGDTNAQGQVWFPGFGWVTPEGDTQTIPGHSDGDINKPVGDM